MVTCMVLNLLGAERVDRDVGEGGVGLDLLCGGKCPAGSTTSLQQNSINNIL